MGRLDLATPLRHSRVAVNFNPDPQNCLWVTMARAPDGTSQNFSTDLLRELCALQKSIRDANGAWLHNGAMRPIDYVVLRSAHPDYFSLGGDLAHFQRCIQRGDRRALREYAMLCVDMVYDWSTRMSHRTTSIALVQGRALGGGFEAALASDYILAEEHSEFGFPEILFGLFPCTGGMSLLAQRVGVRQAERMMADGRIYTARELHTMGVIDELCPRGQGTLAVEKFIAAHRRHRAARLRLQCGRHRLAPLNYEELRTVVEEWVELAMNLGADDLRVMDMLIQMQRARVVR